MAFGTSYELLESAYSVIPLPNVSRTSGISFSVRPGSESAFLAHAAAQAEFESLGAALGDDFLEIFDLGFGRISSGATGAVDGDLAPLARRPSRSPIDLPASFPSKSRIANSAPATQTQRASPWYL